MIIKGHPAAKITDIENVEIVFKDGVGYDSEKLIQSVQGLVGIRYFRGTTRSCSLIIKDELSQTGAE